MVLFFAVLGTLLFSVAGSVRIPALWIYLGLLLLGSVANLVGVIRQDPALLAERMKPAEKGQDPLLRYLIVLLFAGHLIVAALDAGRFHFSDTVPLPLQVIGFVGFSFALSLSCWSMSTNRFFSSDARIQKDRGHVVITDGPYQYIRHPGYAAAFLMGLAGTLALGSWCAVVPAIPAMGLIMRRLLLEERMLADELPGYVDYMDRVRWRVFPGVF